MENDNAVGHEAQELAGLMQAVRYCAQLLSHAGCLLMYVLLQYVLLLYVLLCL